jgi:hypothetical protein
MGVMQLGMRELPGLKPHLSRWLHGAAEAASHKSAPSRRRRNALLESRGRGKPRLERPHRGVGCCESGGKPPHSKMGWAWMLGGNGKDRTAGCVAAKAPSLSWPRQSELQKPVGLTSWQAGAQQAAPRPRNDVCRAELFLGFVVLGLGAWMFGKLDGFAGRGAVWGGAEILDWPADGKA